MDDTDLMITSNSNANVLEYRDRSQDYRDLSRILRVLAGALVVFAVAPAVVLPFRLPPGSYFLAGVLAVMLGLRIYLKSFKPAWFVGIAAFGLLAGGMVTNEFHGRPTVLLHVLIAWWGAAFGLSFIGLLLDGRQLRGRGDIWVEGTHNAKKPVLRFADES